MSKRSYMPPIPWERIDAMIVAADTQRWASLDIAMAVMAVNSDLHKAVIDRATLDEIVAALYALRNVYQDELAKTLPPRRTAQRDLMDAAVARCLVEKDGLDIMDAMTAATGAHPIVERDSVIATHSNRNKILGRSGMGGIQDWREWRIRVRWARRRARQWDCCAPRKIDAFNNSVTLFVKSAIFLGHLSATTGCLMPKPATNGKRAMSLKTFRETKYECSRASVNNYIASGELKTFLDGSRRMILEEDADDFIARKAAQGGQVPPEVSARKSAAGRKGVEAQRAMKRASIADEAKAKAEATA